MPRLAALLLVSLSFGVPLRAQTWRPIGPDGGVSGTLAASASQPGVVYFFGRSSGDSGFTLYRSPNGGQRWRRLPSSPLAELLVVDPRSASTLYGRLSVDGGLKLAKSVDSGAHWALADRGLEEAEALAPVGAPVADPGHPGRLLTPTSLGLFESTDGAASWQLFAQGATPVDAFAIDPGVPSHWLAAIQVPIVGFCPAPEEPCTMPDILESFDAGRTWASTAYRVNAGPRQLLLGAGEQYALVNGTVQRRSPGGTWGPAGALASTAFQLALAPGGTLYAATGVGVYRSTDDGASWRPSPATARPIDTVVSLALLPDAAATLLASGFEEVWRSADAGRTWQASSTGLSGQDIRSLMVTADSTVYAAPDFEGILASSDAGTTWSVRNSGLGVDLPPFTGNIASFSIGDLASDPHDPATVYTLVTRDVTRGYLAKSTDQGRSWQILPPLPTGGFYFLESLFVDPGSSRSLYVIARLLSNAGGGTETDVLLHSANGGVSWRRLLADDQAIATIAVDPRNSATLYAWTFHRGLLKSTNGGASWRATDPRLPSPGSSLARTLVIDPRHSQTLYAGTYQGVYVSRDGGATFTAMRQGLPTTTYSRRLLIDPRHPSKLYLLDQEGLFRWLPTGATWEPLEAGLPAGLPLSAGDLALDPGDPDILYLGTAGRGVYRLDLGASP